MKQREIIQEGGMKNIIRLEVRKTTLSEANHGRCGNANNCYYTGASTRWIIIDVNDEDPGDHIEIYHTKKKAQAVCDYINNNGGFNGIGCIDMRFNGWAQQTPETAPMIGWK